MQQNELKGKGVVICSELTHEIVYRSCELKIVLQKKSYAVFEVIFAPRLELSSPVWGTNQELSSEKRQTVSVTLHNELVIEGVLIMHSGCMLPHACQTLSRS